MVLCFSGEDRPEWPLWWVLEVEKNLEDEYFVLFSKFILFYSALKRTHFIFSPYIILGLCKWVLLFSTCFFSPLTIQSLAHRICQEMIVELSTSDLSASGQCRNSIHPKRKLIFSIVIYEVWRLFYYLRIFGPNTFRCLNTSSAVSYLLMSHFSKRRMSLSPFPTWLWCMCVTPETFLFGSDQAQFLETKFRTEFDFNKYVTIYVIEGQ